MAGKRKKEIELRYYEVPQGEQVLALLGEEWVRVYGEGPDRLHFHNLMEVGLCIDGEGIVALDDNILPYAAGMLTVIPTNFPHTTMSKNESESAWEYLFLDPELILREVYPTDELFVKRIMEKINKRALYFYQGENPELTEIVRLIMDECRYRKSYSLESVRGLLLSFVMIVARSDVTALPENGAEHRGKYGIQQIEPAIHYIEEHYMDEIRMEDLAKECNLSETHFRRIFGENMNMTPVEHMTLVRVRNACDLMKRTRYSMQEVAEHVGYPTVSTFNRNLKKIIGTSPYQYKKNSANYEGKMLNYKVTAKKGW